MMKTMKSLWSSPYFADAEIFSGIVSVQAHCGLEQCVGVLERGRGKERIKGGRKEGKKGEKRGRVRGQEEENLLIKPPPSTRTGSEGFCPSSRVG